MPIDVNALYQNSQKYKTLDDYKNAMAANASAWGSADANTRDQLHSANVLLGQQIGATYDSGSGKWDYSNAKVPVQTATTTTTDNTQGTTKPMVNENTAANYIKSSYDENYAAQAQKLKAARDAALAGLAGQEDLVNQQRTQSLNAGDVMAERNRRLLRENMAQNGLNASGDSISAQIGQDTAAQQVANQTNMNAANQLKQILAQRDAINNNANADDLALMQSLQAQRDQAMANQYNTDRSFGLQEAGVTGRYNDAPTLAALEADRNYGLNYANTYGTGLNGLQTLAARNSDRDYGLNYSQASGVLPDGTQTLAAKNMMFNQGLARDQFDLQKSGQAFDQDYKNRQLDQAGKQFAQQMGYDYAKLSQDQKQFMGDLAMKYQQMNLQGLQNGFKYDPTSGGYVVDPTSPEYMLKDAQAQMDTARAKNYTADALKQGTDQAFKDAVTLAQKDPRYLTLSDDDRTALVQSYYNQLKPNSGVSPSDIAQYLKK